MLSLFHTRTLYLTADHPVTLLIDATPHILDPGRRATLRATAAGLTVELATPTVPTHFVARAVTLPPETFTLSVPDKLTRTYTGALVVDARAHTLQPVVTMETELAVASIVAAEAPPNAPIEALKAQAVASRSFLLAHASAHTGVDACDTTHCQYLRSPPPPSSAATLATRATRNLVLTWRPTPDAPLAIVAAMFSRSCGGRTSVPPPSPDRTRYPFYPVACAFCLRHPERWTRPSAPALTSTEQQRLAFNRAHGWDAMPSTTYTASANGLEGRGTGHGVGLCQLGASDLAARGATFRAILGHYFQNTQTTLLP